MVVSKVNLSEPIVGRCGNSRGGSPRWAAVGVGFLRCSAVKDKVTANAAVLGVTPARLIQKEVVGRRISRLLQFGSGSGSA